MQYPSRETQLHATIMMTVESSRKVYVEAACLTWKQLFTSWFNAIKTEPWLENHDVILQQLFQWLLPPLLSCISTCRCFPPPSSPTPSIFSPFQIGCSNFLPQLGPRKPRPVPSVASGGSPKLEGEKIPPWMDPGFSLMPFLLTIWFRPGWCMLAHGALAVASQMRESEPSLTRAFARSSSSAIMPIVPKEIYGMLCMACR